MTAPGDFGSASPVRPSSPSGTPPYGRRLDGSEEGQARRFVDYKMDPAPAWDLRLWLIEAEARLPANLIGKRIIDAIPFGSRLAALLSHLGVEDITAPDGYKRIIGIIEESHAYLKEARLEQAFEAAIFKGKRRYGQTITGFLASKKAAFSELKNQGLDLLETDAGNHLLGHLLLKQGGFTNDQQQRIRVLTDGSIDYRKVEVAIRKVFGDTLDETPTRSYWADDDEQAVYFGEGHGEDDGDYGGLDLFEDI